MVPTCMPYAGQILFKDIPFFLKIYRTLSGKMYNNEELEIVEAFKYLGVIFNYTGNFRKCKMYVKDQATKAMFALLSKGRRPKLPIDIIIIIIF